MVDQEGNRWNCRIGGRFRTEERKATNPVAVGDVVDFRPGEQEDGELIINIHERENYLIRKASRADSQWHIIASNLDQAVVVATIASPRTSQGFIDRFLVTCEAYEIEPVLVFNKIDLYSDKEEKQLQRWVEMYSSLGYTCLPTSVETGEGFDKLHELLQGKTTLFMGHSGAGKSSMLNRLLPDLNLKTSDISKFSGKGRHTTTFAEMYALNEESNVIDTPGIKEFGLVDFEPAEVCHFFPEMVERQQECRFANCLHVNEPGCAVIPAVEAGEIQPPRYISYLSILEDFEEKERR